MQYLGEIDGRKVYNDSKATNILATQKALSGFDNSKLWLLAGGLDRGNGFEELEKDLQDLKGMVVLGKQQINYVWLQKNWIFRFDSENVAKALEEILPQTQAGDTILLSPACASWDQYKTFEERGDLFIQAFENLKK